MASLRSLVVGRRPVRVDRLGADRRRPRRCRRWRPARPGRPLLHLLVSALRLLPEGRAPGRPRPQDLTQGLFASLLENDFLDVIDPRRRGGSARSCWRAARTSRPTSRLSRDRARKRGGGCLILSIDLPDAEGRYSREPSHEATPERLFRDVDGAAPPCSDRCPRPARRRDGPVGQGGAAFFDRLKPGLCSATGATSGPYARGGRRAGDDRRRRERWRPFGSVAATATCSARRCRGPSTDPGEVDDEIRDLFRALAP